MSGLSYEEMKEVSLAFQGAHDFVISNADAETAVPVIMQFIGQVVVTLKPYMLTTNEGVTAATSMVFKNRYATDYVLSVWFLFASRWAKSDESILALASNLGRGCTQNVAAEQKNSLVPEEYKARLPTRSMTIERLASNPWLMVLLLLSSVIKIPTTKQ